MKKILYTLLVGVMALSSCDKSDGAPEKKPDDGGGKIEKVYKVGDVYPDATSPIGIVFWVDETDKSYDATAKTAAKGKIVSLDEMTNTSWSGEQVVTGATSDTDGAANTAKVLALESYTAETYPGFAWCAAKNTPVVEGINWYIPAISELKDGICANKAILRTSLALVDGADALWDNAYWSSTEYRADQAQYVILSTDVTTSIVKSVFSSIAFRAVSAF